ncbi:MAG: GNAT family acetyltransferase [Butyrivibrio sp.]|nr:GNAT family acetyltransferase [Butyrivibrio sp.]
MNRILIMCEGPNEKKIIDILLANGCLKFTQDDLLGLTPFHARQISNSGQVRAELNIYPGIVDVYRIGDKQSDKLTIPKDYKEKIGEVKKYCTKPELEMLLIIAEGLDKDYDKVKSTMSPKEFAKANIKIGKKRYDNSTKFYQEYFENNVKLLVDAIKKYQRIRGKSHDKDELCLGELLK